MIHIKKIALSTVAVIALGAGSAMADGFTSHHLTDEKSYEDYAEEMSAQQKLDLRNYLDYAQREPCQEYKPAPEGFVKVGCTLKHKATGREVVSVTTTKREPVSELRLGKVITDYEINFDFDSATIEPNADNTLDKIANEIMRYDPREVTLAGHADKAGPSDYNVALSERRANAVSDALNNRGITNRVLDEEAYGESNPAIDTKDGVALRENRRVVVEFRK